MVRYPVFFYPAIRGFIVIPVMKRILRGGALVLLGVSAIGCTGHSPSARSIGDMPEGYRIDLPALSEAERRAIEEANEDKGEAMMVGLDRELDGQGTAVPLTELNWEPNGESQVAVFSVHSPSAAALRLGLAGEGVPCALSFRFAGTDGELSESIPASRLEQAESPWWTPITPGDTAHVLLTRPTDSAPNDCALRLTGVSHLY